MTTVAEPTTRVVRVWFGKHKVAEYEAESALAARYAAAMSRRFPSLQVTNQPLPKSPGSGS